MAGGTEFGGAQLMGIHPGLERDAGVAHLSRTGTKDAVERALCIARKTSQVRICRDDPFSFASRNGHDGKEYLERAAGLSVCTPLLIQGPFPPFAGTWSEQAIAVDRTGATTWRDFLPRRGCLPHMAVCWKEALFYLP